MLNIMLKLAINNFRPIHIDEEKILTFTLLDLNIFMGPRGVGKSSIIEALRLLSLYKRVIKPYSESFKEEEKHKKIYDAIKEVFPVRYRLNLYKLLSGVNIPLGDLVNILAKKNYATILLATDESLSGILIHQHTDRILDIDFYEPNGGVITTGQYYDTKYIELMKKAIEDIKSMGFILNLDDNIVPLVYSLSTNRLKVSHTRKNSDRELDPYKQYFGIENKDLQELLYLLIEGIGIEGDALKILIKNARNYASPLHNILYKQFTENLDNILNRFNEYIDKYKLSSRKILSITYDHVKNKVYVEEEIRDKKWFMPYEALSSGTRNLIAILTLIAWAKTLLDKNIKKNLEETISHSCDVWIGIEKTLKKLITTRDIIVCIEEPEVALHTSTFSILLKLIQEEVGEINKGNEYNKLRLIMTTHSIKPVAILLKSRSINAVNTIVHLIGNLEGKTIHEEIHVADKIQSLFKIKETRGLTILEEELDFLSKLYSLNY